MKKILIILIGIIVSGVGIFLLINEKGLSKRCTVEAVGTVVDIRVEESTEEEDGLTRTVYTYFPVIEYNARDKIVSKKSNTGSNSEKYNIKDRVDILYNPNNIEEYIIKGDKTGNILGVVFIVAGIVVVVIGIIKRL